MSRKRPPRPSPTQKPRAPLDPVVPYILVRLIVFIVFPHCSEDAYITFRAARNLLSSGRPVFNVGEASWPSSSPLWTAWSALGLGMQIPIEAWAHLGSLTAEVLLLQAVGRIAGPHVKRNFTVLVGLSQGAIAMSTSGIEMWAMVAAFAWALTGSATGRVLLACSRPEGLVLQFLAPWWKQPWWVSLIGPAVWGLMAVLCGRWAPAGVTAKVGAYGFHLFEGRAWTGIFWPFRGEPDALSIGVLGLSSIALAFWWWKAKPTRSEWLFVSSGLILVLAYWAVGAVYFYYYYTLPIAALSLLIARAAETFKPGWPIALLVALLSWPFTTIPARRWETQYRDLSRLAGLLQDGDTCTLDAVGVTGWLLPNARFIDTIGLTSPRAEVERRKGDGWLQRLILAEKPDWVVLLKAEVTSNDPEAGTLRMFTEERFLARRYTLTGTENESGNPLLIIHREDWTPAWHPEDPAYAQTPEMILWDYRLPSRAAPRSP